MNLEKDGQYYPTRTNFIIQQNRRGQENMNLHIHSPICIHGVVLN
jgi:hypothetical protein